MKRGHVDISQVSLVLPDRPPRSLSTVRMELSPIPLSPSSLEEAPIPPLAKSLLMPCGPGWGRGGMTSQRTKSQPSGGPTNATTKEAHHRASLRSNPREREQWAGLDRVTPCGGLSWPQGTQGSWFR